MKLKFSAITWSWQKKSQLFLCSCLLANVLASDIPQEKQKILAVNYSQFVVNKINQIGENITVKIWADGNNFLGSGTIIKKQDNRYEVVTNSHVIRARNPPYLIQTPDGKIYHAQVIAETTKKSWDLAFLTFDSLGQSYKTADLGNSNLLKVGDYVFAAGFPGNQIETETETTPKSNELTQETQVSNSVSLEEFSFTIGRVSLVLEKSLTAGYQIGSTNMIQKGMSGGPLLNEQGQLIGINGKHAYPLWEAPDFYEDGLQTCPQVQELINQNSWAIPIEKVNQFYVEIGLLPATLNPQIQKDFNLALVALDNSKVSPKDLITQMQALATKTMSCQD
jgi:serine protease Do